MDTKLDIPVFLFIVGLNYIYCQPLPHVRLTLGTESAQFTTSCLEYKYFMVDATEPCMGLRINVTQVAGEPNLYVSRGLNYYPTLRNLAWSSYNWGSESKVISSMDPDYRVGTFYIGVHAYCGDDVKTGNTSAQYTVHVSHIPETEEDEDLYGKEGSGQIQAQEYKNFRFCAPKQCVSIDVRLKHCQSYDQEGCNNRYGFPELLISKTVPQPKKSDMAWMLAEMPRRTITLSPTDVDFEPGHHFMSVFGWCTPAEQCPNRTTCGPCDLINNLNFKVSVTPTDIDQESCKKMLEGRPKQGDCVGGTVATGMQVSTVLLVLLMMKIIL